jgi:endonuclease-3
MDIKQCHTLFARLQAQNPHPGTELHYRTPFELLIAVILSAQATDKSVNKVTAVLFNLANTPSQILALGEEQLKEHIKSIGLANTKARNIINTCQTLIAKYNNEVPQERAALETLSGVGRKTANVILNTAFGKPTIAVDTHIFRVANRTGLATGKTARVVENQLLVTIAPEFRQNAHHWLILHGRYTCVARQPKCGQCIINDLCAYPHKTGRIA